MKTCICSGISIIIDGYAIRPDFYLPEFDLYIEYWGMDTSDHKIGMLKKPSHKPAGRHGGGEETPCGSLEAPQRRNPPPPPGG